MPFDSIVGLGNHRPQQQSALSTPESITKPSQSFSPWSHEDKDVRTSASDSAIEAFFSPQPMPPVKISRLSHVRLRPGTVRLDPAWKETSLGPAIDGCNLLKMQRIEPGHLQGLTQAQRRTLYAALATTSHRVRYVDTTGHRHSRAYILKLPVGRRLHATGAGALLLLMAQKHDEGAFAQALYDGLHTAVPQIIGARGGRLFCAFDVAYVCNLATQFFISDMAQSAAEAALEVCDAASVVVRFLEQNAHGRAAGLRDHLLTLMSRLGPMVAGNPSAMGVALGIVVAGGLRYAEILQSHDSRNRWRIANLCNLVWAAQNLIPFAPVSGGLALLVVGLGIVYDWRSPPRTYQDLAVALQAQVEWLAEHGRLAISMAEGATMVRNLHLSMRACGYR